MSTGPGITVNLQSGQSIIGIPQGLSGKSAYEIAVDNGFVGTEEEWLISLNGGGLETEINERKAADVDMQERLDRQAIAAATQLINLQALIVNRWNQESD